MTRARLLAALAAVTIVSTLSAQQPAAPAAPPPSQQPPAQQPPAQQPPAQQPPAQQPPGQQPERTGQQPPVFRGGTNQVRVDVTVLDRKGLPITDLTKEDFEVREDGIEQSIDTLKLIEA